MKDKQQIENWDDLQKDVSLKLGRELSFLENLNLLKIGFDKSLSDWLEYKLKHNL